jgi:hypothetical protein
VLLGATTLVIAACADPSMPLSPERDLGPDVSVTLLAPPAPEALARVAPGFGGFYLDDGQPTVFLTDATDRPSVEGALHGFLVSRGLDESALRVQAGAYRYADLDTWFQAASSALDLPGVHMVDLDEARNRVLIGVDGPGAIGRVRSAMARLGIPDGALLVEQREAIRPMATLRDMVRPVTGGLQINFPGYLCTLGFNATSGSTASFITNSHCTNTQGGVESTPYWQPLQTVAPTQIGTEVADPTYTKQNCPRTIKGRKCRWSDASRAAYAGGITFSLGRIKQTTGANNGSLDIAGEFTITAEDQRTSFTVGETMNKVGRTTGWTAGPVTNTCVHTGVSGTNIVQLCQTHVQAGVAGGDSGSPAFRITSGSNVALTGILWGGGTNVWVFSPLNNIERELGALTVH